MLIYKARKYEGNVHGQMMIGVAIAEQYDGPYRRLSEDPVFPPERCHLEDPFVWWNGDHYELIAKDMDGTSCGERYGGVHAHSEDGLRWELSPHLAYSRKVQREDGSGRRKNGSKCAKTSKRRWLQAYSYSSSIKNDQGHERTKTR